jgi:hypothetical protein
VQSSVRPASPCVVPSDAATSKRHDGALRGLKKAFTTLGDYTPAETILWMVERQEEEFARLNLPFNGLFGRKLHGIDCQGLFCELDKYCREAVPELTSARGRIKARYAAAHGDVVLFFPPKWGLPNGGVLTATGVQAEQQTTAHRRRERKGRRKPDRERLAVTVGRLGREAAPWQQKLN